MTDLQTAQTQLYTRAIEAAERRFGKPLSPDVEARIAEEKRVINERGFQTYFDLIGDILPAPVLNANCTICRPRKAIRLRVASTAFSCECGSEVFSGRHDPIQGCQLVCVRCGQQYAGDPE